MSVIRVQLVLARKYTSNKQMNLHAKANSSCTICSVLKTSHAQNVASCIMDMCRNNGVCLTIGYRTLVSLIEIQHKHCHNT